jgi:MFS family permease
VLPIIAGVVALAVLLAVERVASQPMLPLKIFSNRQFSTANVVTFVVYAALSGGMFLLPIELQRGSGYSALSAGAALVPLSAVMLLLSPRSGRLAQRIGPRLPMTAGPLIAGGGLALFARIGAGANYLTDVLPAVLVFALGLVITVAPLTATVLAAAGPEHAGIASAINNEVARVGGLLAVALLPAVAGITGAAKLTPHALTSGYRIAVVIAAVMAACGGVLSWMLIRNPQATPPLPKTVSPGTPLPPISAAS